MMSFLNQEMIQQLQRDLKKSNELRQTDEVRLRMEAEEDRLTLDAELERTIQQCRSAEEAKRHFEMRNHVLETHMKDLENRFKVVDSDRRTREDELEKSKAEV